MLNATRQQGAALLGFVATMLLLMVGLCAAVTHFLMAGAQLTRHQLDREIALRAAEAALLDAETDLLQATSHDNSARLLAWPAPGTCAEGAQRGLCRAAGDQSAWQAWIDGAVDDADDAIGVPLGTFTGAQLPALPSDVIGANTLPRYLIEVRDDVAQGTSSGQPSWPMFRIAALGFGRDRDVRVLLQTEFQP